MVNKDGLKIFANPVVFVNRSTCSSEYKNPDFVIPVVFVLYVEINLWLDQFGQLLHDTT